MTARRRLRIAWRWPRKAYHWWLSWLIRHITGTPIAHVAVGYGDVVRDPNIRGDRYWAVIDFLNLYPSLVGYFVVPLDNPMPIEAMSDAHPRSAWPTVLRWWTRGLWPTRDCVDVTTHLLRASGVPVPRRIYAPHQLFCWLAARGCEYHSLSAPAAA